MKTAKPAAGGTAGLKVEVGPTVLLRLWLSGFDFSNIKQMISKGSQLKSGEYDKVDSVYYSREGGKIVISSAPAHQDKQRAEQLLKKLITMLSKRGAKEISTL